MKIGVRVFDFAGATVVTTSIGLLYVKVFGQSEVRTLQSIYLMFNIRGVCRSLETAVKYTVENLLSHVSIILKNSRITIPTLPLPPPLPFPCTIHFIGGQRSHVT